MKHTTIVMAFFIAFLTGCSSKRKITGPEPEKMQGTWTLEWISGARITADGLYPEDKPTIEFDTDSGRVSGFSGCNRYNGTFELNGPQLKIGDNLAMTRMFCPGSGELVYTQALKKINGVRITDEHKLELLTEDQVMLRFRQE